jgi:protein-disulfide isomerase/uncharacterized membrane protein
MVRVALTPREKSERLKKTLRWVGALSGIGFLDSLWLLILHAWKGTISGGCSLGPRISCDAIYIQRYSEWFGIPVPVFSILYFALLIAIVIRVLLKGEERYLLRPYVYLWLLSWVGLLTTLSMAYIAVVFVRSFCPYCFLLWVVLTVLWALAWRMMKILDQPWNYIVSEDLRTGFRSQWFWWVSAVAAVVLVSSHFLFDRGVARLVGSPAVIVGEEARSFGSPDAKKTIAVYSDFQCPWCRVASEVLLELSQELKGEIYVVYKFFPLDHSCNESVKRPMHMYACSAALAAYCASMQGKFWVYHDYLFTSQSELPDSRLLSFARTAQLDLMKFDACRRDDRTKEEVQKNIREGIGLGITGTPSIFINGQLYTGPLTLSAFREVLASLR